MVPWPAAGTREGTACARAPKQTSAMRWETSTLPAPTAAGGRAATTEPKGATTDTGRMEPPLEGIPGSAAERKAKATQETVTASTALTLPDVCGSVPVKSKVIVSPDTTTDTQMRTGCCWSGRGPEES